MKEDRCVVCGEIIPEGRQICWKCEQSSRDYHCVICGKEIPQPKFSFGGRAYGKTMYNMRQLCCSDECWDKFAKEIRRELDGRD